jgi:hypothetical protein
MIVLYTCLCLLAPKAASTQAVAKQHFDKAERAYRVGDFDTAISEYEQAYDAKPVPALLYNIAQSYRKRYTLKNQTNDLRRAVEVYRSYLRDDPNSPKQESVEKIVAELKDKLAAVEAQERPAVKPGRLVLTCDGAPADIWIDDAAAGKTPLDVEIAPGAHQLRATRAGASTWTATVEVTSGDTVRQTLALAPIEAATAPTAPAPRPVYKRWWFWTAAGVVVAGGAVAAYELRSGSKSGPVIDLSH